MVTDKLRVRRYFPVALLLLLTSIILHNALFGFSYTVGPNYRNVSVDTTVNVTNTPPVVLGVTVDDPITLVAGGSVVVVCNASIRDYNGGDTISNVSAVFYDNATVFFNSSDDNNTHYTNTTCTNTSINSYYANFTCHFDVEYYANAGSNWICNVTVTDSYNFSNNVTGSDSGYNTTTINTLLALNISTQLINYGNLSVGDTSTAQEANVTNYGNQNINISVKGYGVTENDGLALVCAFGNITIANEKFSLNQSGDFLTQYNALGSAFQMIQNLTIPQQTNDSQQEINSTYWRLYIPPAPFGICNGTVVFQAESST